MVDFGIEYKNQTGLLEGIVSTFLLFVISLRMQLLKTHSGHHSVYMGVFCGQKLPTGVKIYVCFPLFFSFGECLKQGLM